MLNNFYSILFKISLWLCVIYYILVLFSLFIIDKYIFNNPNSIEFFNTLHNGNYLYLIKIISGFSMMLAATYFERCYGAKHRFVYIAYFLILLFGATLVLNGIKMYQVDNDFCIMLEEKIGTRCTLKKN